MNKFLVSNYTKSLILYFEAKPQTQLVLRLWLAYLISMLTCRIIWIFFICIVKASALTSLILLGGGLAGSKPMQGWNSLFAKKGTPL